jgi:hypothetical protein
MEPDSLKLKQACKRVWTRRKGKSKKLEFLRRAQESEFLRGLNRRQLPQRFIVNVVVQISNCVNILYLP